MEANSGANLARHSWCCLWLSLTAVLTPSTCVCLLDFPNLLENGLSMSHGSEIVQVPWEYKSLGF